jgi:hypothetical protein
MTRILEVKSKLLAMAMIEQPSSKPINDDHIEIEASRMTLKLDRDDGSRRDRSRKPICSPCV